MVLAQSLWESDIRYHAPLLTPGSVGKSGLGAGVTESINTDDSNRPD